MLAPLFEEAFDDPPLLIDLDGKDAAVGRGIVKCLAGLGECVRELSNASAEDAREPQEDWCVDAAPTDGARQLEEVGARTTGGVRVDLQVPVLVDGEEPGGPGGDLVEVGA